MDKNKTINIKVNELTLEDAVARLEHSSEILEARLSEILFNVEIIREHFEKGKE